MSSLDCQLLRQGRNWLPNTGWAISNVACGRRPAAGGSFYSVKNWVGNCPPFPPASYAPDTSKVSQKISVMKT